jgi:outer membrane protein assembly factor BamB
MAAHARRSIARVLVLAAALAGAALGIAVLWGGPARAQTSNQLDLSGAVQLDEVDNAVRTHLEQARAYVANHQWEEAVETYRLLMENYGGKVIAVSPRRYIRLADYCHLQIAALPPSALALYRKPVDPVAQRWYADGIAQRDPALLARIVSDMYCSTWGDDALLALGDMALERGEASVARSYWDQIIERPPEWVPKVAFEGAIAAADIDPLDRTAVTQWYESDPSPRRPGYRLRHEQRLTDDEAQRLVRFWKAARLPTPHLAYPSTSLDPADVRARLVLASIFDGSLARAKGELEAFEQLHPTAAGNMAGKHEPYAQALTRLLAEAESWPGERMGEDWPTFAGNPARNKIAREAIDVGAPLWPAIPLGEPLSADATNVQRFGSYRVAERTDGLLSYHPVVVGDMILVSTSHQIFAFDLHTGKPVWPGNPQKPAGEIYREGGPNGALERPTRGLGVPRYTMTVYDGRLYTRVGSQVTTHATESNDSTAGRLICLDLSAEGRMVWQIEPDDDRWAFEGAPLVSGTDLYVVMRRSDVRPQVHVACFDAETGHRRWRTMLCAAETPAGGQMEELTHDLLTLAEGVLYANTNLGAVGAVSTLDGHLLWISTYPRARRLTAAGQDKRLAHFYRDLNPCVYHQGSLFVAPADSESILALDAGSGQPLWETSLAADTVHLLGVGEGNLIASGDHLWWIDAVTGKISGHWPDQSPHGYGRGILAGDKIFWPTRDMLYVFRQAVPPGGRVTLARDPIPLADARKAGGGNLLISRGVLLIAAADKLYGFGQRAGRLPVTAAKVEPRPPAGSNRRVIRP